ncbi:hypothetical protein GUITHDRAFT_139479 [Guillardia theta CCMP2712]|uniref:IPT/TIG domain-containing protein n=1 Tax=Guillardia theta (strain CCMP2712) TaxID=905079 RepID=L1J9V6_GUITC|nr:hypothetical protein GUITHDRAFT_139479 [Guillardia theta CCMP2712]EKX44870.1 hypothetical protein GUITHDRAFT_139479 [Guillardia theta CCMP2712]|eukprot:XP_005831850.1 hypothetical protein GUITHDRAFT_139479 [Guillardia theta CCMP2712]
MHTARHAVMALVLVLVLVPGTAKKRRKDGDGGSLPDADALARAAVPASFGFEIANVSRVATKLRYWNEYERTSKEIVKTIMREAEKGTRILKFEVINPDRIFNQDGGMGPYNEVLDFMLKGKMNLKDESGREEAIVNPMFACIPMRERYKPGASGDSAAESLSPSRFCIEKISRASRLGSWISVVGRNFELKLLMISSDRRIVIDGRQCLCCCLKVCEDCFYQRLQTTVKAVREGEVECVELSDQQSENLLPQVPGNWTIDVSTRTTIGSMRMEEKKFLPIGSRWSQLPAIHSVILSELMEGNLHVRPLGSDGNPLEPLTPGDLRDKYFGKTFNFAVYLW